MKKIVSLVLVIVLVLSVLPMAVFAEGNTGEIVLPPDCFHSYTYADNEDGETHTVTCKYCGGSYNEAHSFVEGVCICGAVEAPVGPVIPTQDTNIVFETVGPTALNLMSYVGVQFFFRIPSRTTYDRVYATVTINGEDPIEYDGILYSGSRYYYTEAKFAPKELTADFVITLYGEKDGVLYTGESMVTSVRDLIVEKMDADYANVTGGTEVAKNEAHLRMLADLLVYGEKAQIRLSYRTDDLATVGVSDTYMGYATKTVPSISGSVQTVATGATSVTMYGDPALSVASSVEVQPMLKKPKATAFDSFVVRFEWTDTADGAQHVDITSADYYTSGNYLNIIFNALPAKGMRTEFTMTACDATTGTPVGPSYKMSIEALAALKLGSDEIMTNLMNAMMNYGDSAAYYINREYEK